MKNFFQTVKISIYSPQFYSTILKKPLKESVFYFLLFILFLTIIHLLNLVKPLFLDTPVNLQTFVTNAISCFPNDLEIKINEGKASINVEEPYFISSCGSYQNHQPLLVIDTKTPFSNSKFDEYKAVAWLTKESVIYKQNDYETRSYSLAQIKDYKLDKQTLDSYYSQFSPWLKFVGPILFTFFGVGIYLLYLFRLIYLLIPAAIVTVLSKILKKPLTFSQSYKVSLYALTLGLIIELIINLTTPWTQFRGFPFMTTFILLGVVILNLFLPEKRQNHHKPS